MPGKLAVTPDVGEVFMDMIHEYPDLTVHLTLFHATITEGIPQKLEHNDICWITVDEIGRFEFCPADAEILRRLKSAYQNLSQICAQPHSRDDRSRRKGLLLRSPIERGLLQTVTIEKIARKTQEKEVCDGQ